MGALKVILIVLGILVAVVGITALQIYSFVQYIQDDAPDIEQDMKAVNEGDCSRLDNLETEVLELISKSKSLCRNPIINLGLGAIEAAPIKCYDIDDVEDAMNGYIDLMVDRCATGEDPDPEALKEVIDQFNRISGGN